MLNITKLIGYIPSEIKEDIIDFNNVIIKSNNKPALRVTIGHILTEEEHEKLSKNKRHILDKNLICQYRYAPEIKHSYFYVF